MRSISRRVAAVLVAAVVIAASGVAGAFGSSGASDTVTVRQNGAWVNFDFQSYTPGLAWFVAGAYDRLVALSDGKVVPYLATKWRVTPRSVTLTLRKDAKCANGNKITPNVVQQSFQRLFTVPKNGVNLSNFFGPGPYAMTADQKKWTVTFTTKTPFRGIIYGLASDQAGIVCPAGLKNPDQLKTSFLGSGPYSFVSATPGDQVVMKLRKDWTWGPVINGKQLTAKALPDTQVWKVVANDTTAANLMLTGGLDVARIAGPDIQRLSADKSFARRTVKVTWPAALSYNVNPGRPLADKALRQALSTAVDAKTMSLAMTLGLGKPVTSFIQPGYECYSPKTKALYPANGSIDKAKQILSQAGYKGVGSNLTTSDGKPVKLNVKFIKSLTNGAGEYVLGVWRQLGVDVNLLDGDGTTVSTAVFRGDFDVAIALETNTVPDVSTTAINFFYGKTVPQGGLNLFGPSAQVDPKWNLLIRAGMKNVGSLGCKYWQQAQEYALKEAVFLPVTTADFYIFDRKGSGWTSLAGYRPIDPLFIRKG